MMKKRVLECYLDSRRIPIGELAGAQQLHGRIRDEGLMLCLRVLADPNAHVSHRAAMFVELVRSHDINKDELVDSLALIPASDLLPLLDALRMNRINGRRACDLGLRLLLGREDLPEIAAFHRQRVIRVLKHLVGEKTWATVKRALVEGIDADSYNVKILQRKLLRFALDRGQAVESLCFLAGLGLPAWGDREPKKTSWLVVPWLKSGKAPANTAFSPTVPVLIQALDARRDWNRAVGMPKQNLSGIRGTYFAQTTWKKISAVAANTAPTHSDGPVTTAIKLWLQGRGDPIGVSKDEFPIEARVGLIVDASASMRSSGERLNHPAALGQAVVHRIEASIRSTSEHVAGGISEAGFLKPAGVADLATALLDTAAESLDAVFVVSDGYENCRQTDFAAVVSGLRNLGISLPIYQVTPVFTRAEDLSQRKLSDDVPVIQIEHESQAGELIARAQLAASEEELSDEQVRKFCRYAMN